ASVGVPAIQSFAQDNRPTVDVLSYGAVGDGVTDDTAAIQRANNAIAAAGGGVVHFPPGTYVAMGVRLSSGVELFGTTDAVLKHPDGISPGHIIQSTVLRKQGWIVEGSNHLWISDTKGVLPGAIVGIRGAGGASDVQTAKLSFPVLADSTSLTVSQGQGWSNRAQSLLIEDEIVAYAGRSSRTFSITQRGLLGTSAVAHPKNAPVSLLQGLYARVVAVGNGWVKLDRVAVQGVQATEVNVGSINVAVRGLTLDGNRVPNGSASNPFPIKLRLARWAVVEGSTIINGDHGAISLDEGTSESVVADNTLLDHGTLSKSLGSAVWLYRGATDNVISGNVIGGETNNGVMVDDRSESATEWDAPSDGNMIQSNVIDFPRSSTQDTGVWVVGSQGNVVEDNDIRSTTRGISVTVSTQGIRPASARGTVVRSNRLWGHYLGVYVTGNDNWIERNEIRASTKPIIARGTGNTYVENWIG
ncbi:MAG: glycosyl hydrolase family 28-related protein, partial [Actinomycetota bacterium]